MSKMTYRVRDKHAWYITAPYTTAYNYDTFVGYKILSQMLSKSGSLSTSGLCDHTKGCQDVDF